MLQILDVWHVEILTCSHIEILTSIYSNFDMLTSLYISKALSLTCWHLTHVVSQILDTRHSSSTVRQCELVVRQIADGLCQNTVIEKHVLLTHAYAALKADETPKMLVYFVSFTIFVFYNTTYLLSHFSPEVPDKAKMSLRPEDCRLLQPEPGN